MIRETLTALLACVVSFVLCAVAYPVAVWGLAQLAFPHQAEGSLVYDRDRTVIGSELIAQPFASDRYFQPRPSAVDYKADAAGGSNLGTKNPDLQKKIVERAEALKASAERPVPVDLVTASGSGLDPEISEAAAMYQVPKVAAARQLSETQIRDLVEKSTDRSAAFIGAPPRVNVLKLNMALDETKPTAAVTPSIKRSMSEQPSTATVEVSHDEATTASTLAGDTTHAASAGAAKGAAAGARETPGEALSQRLDQLEKMIVARPVDQIAADLKEVKAKAVSLGEEVRDVRVATSRLDKQFTAIGQETQGLLTNMKTVKESLKARENSLGLERQIQPLRSELASIRAAVQRLETVAKEARPSTSEYDLTPAVKLFAERQYAPALSAFRTLAQAHPDDARLWYYSALASGLATGQWRGEAEDYVSKGVERERAGTPPSATVDATFVGLTPNTGRDWLQFYRKNAAQTAR